MVHERESVDVLIGVRGVRSADALGIGRKVMKRFRNVVWVRCLWADLTRKHVRVGERRKVTFWIAGCIAVSAVCLLVSCATPTNPAAAEGPPFHDETNADLIVRYYSDKVSHVQKPPTMEGPFFTACERPMVLKVAAEQPKRELAVLVLMPQIYRLKDPELAEKNEDQIKAIWERDLKRVGFQHVVFLRAGRGMQVYNLPTLKGPRFPATGGQ